MIIDYLLEFSVKQKLTAAAESDYHLDFIQTAPTSGLDGRELTVFFTVNEDITGDIDFHIQDSADCETFKDLVVSGIFSSPKAGTHVALTLPHTHKQYLRVYYGQSPSAGTVSAFLGVDDNAQHNDGFEQTASITELDKVLKGE